MKITKFGHACLLIEQDEARILVDPGSWSTVPELTYIDAVLITHEHGDHLDVQKIDKILEDNTEAVVLTNDRVGKILTEHNILFTRLADGDTTIVKQLTVQGVGREHAIIYGTESPCENTGYLIDDLFIPGDALSAIPATPVRVLALPTSGPWMKLSEAIDYAKKLSPKTVFPIHDALYTEEVRRGMIPRIVGGNIEVDGITFMDLKDRDVIEV